MSWLISKAKSTLHHAENAVGNVAHDVGRHVANAAGFIVHKTGSIAHKAVGDLHSSINWGGSIVTSGFKR